MRTFFILLLVFSQMGRANTESIAGQISDYLQHQQSAQLALLEKLVNINSGTRNLAGVHRVGEMLRPEFEALGFKVHWEEEPAKLKRAGTLIAEHVGGKGKRLLLIGHLDTVFPADSPFQQFKRQGDFARGPGVVDDKGGDVVILYALKALEALHVLKEANITVVLTGDEEDSGKPTAISRKPLIDAARKSDLALDFESAVSLNTASIARRGISGWVLTTEGKQGHSSQIFQANTGFGAIYELARILNAMRVQFADEKYLSCNPGRILGGTTVRGDLALGKENVIAKKAIASGDLRFLTEAQKKKAENTISAIVNAHLPLTKVSARFREGIPAMPPTQANLKLLEQYSQASITLGFGAVSPLDPGKRGAGDISHIASLVSASLVGLGPLGTGEHSSEETLDIRSLPIQTGRAALLMYWLTL